MSVYERERKRKRERERDRETESEREKDRAFWLRSKSTLEQNTPLRRLPSVKVASIKRTSDLTSEWSVFLLLLLLQGTSLYKTANTHTERER